MKPSPTEFRCPNCGVSISPNARSCRCGAEREGPDWLVPSRYDGLDLAEDDFDYDEFVRREFGEGGKPKNWFTRMSPKERAWWIVGVIMLVVFLLFSIGA